MPEIIFQRLKSTATGVAASTGKQTEVAFNENFDKVKQLLDVLFDIAAITVTSEQITQLKADTTTNPYTLYYTTDSPTAATINWHRLVLSDFASLTGDPNDNIALKTILDSKGSASDVAILQGQMSSAQTDLTRLDTLTDQHDIQIGANSAAITTLQGDVADRVRVPHGDTLYLRYVTATTSIEYSTDGLSWTDISSLGVSFADITGAPSDNANLVTYVTTQINNAISSVIGDYVTTTQFNQHVNNTSNPHSVTKAQVGLSDVENYSMQTMPIPKSVQTELNTINSKIGGLPSTVSTKPSTYRSSTPESGTIYFTSKAYD